ncbi:MAG: response regulator [Methanoregula sp.]|nr:response regulator [Methanoregula sp.]
MLSILLVDDEPAILDIAKLFLEKTGTITAVTAASAKEALLLLKKQSFDTIVSDYEMPEMTGVQFLRELRIHGDHTPFIIFTGKGREQIVVEALNAGATFYLEKGANPRALFTELSNQIHQAVNRRTAESALKESEEKYRALIEHGLEGIVILDLLGKILFANHAAARTFEIENVESFIGRNALEFIAPASKSAVTHDINNVVARGTDAYLAVHHCKTDKGKDIWIDSIGKRIMYEGAPADLVSIRNITPLKQATERLEILNNKLKLVSNVMRHDIRNKITAVSGYTELAKTATRDPEIIAYLEKQEPLLDDILEELEFVQDYEKLGSDLPSWQDADAIVQSFLPLLLKQGITLDHSVKGFWIYADPLLERVFSNLIDNSLRHGGNVRAIRFIAKIQGTNLVISYEDDGMGIPADQKKRVFEKGVGANTGLGLFLVQEILAITGITITETGVPGKGVRFELLVPEGGYEFKGKQS